MFCVSFLLQGCLPLVLRVFYKDILQCFHIFFVDLHDAPLHRVANHLNINVVRHPVAKVADGSNSLVYLLVHCVAQQA